MVGILLAVLVPVMQVSAAPALTIYVNEQVNRTDIYNPYGTNGPGNSTGYYTNLNQTQGAGTIYVFNNRTSGYLNDIRLSFNKGNTSDWAVASTSPTTAYKIEETATNVTFHIPRINTGSSNPVIITYTVNSSVTPPLTMNTTYDENRVVIGGNRTMTINVTKSADSSNIIESNITVSSCNLDNDGTADFQLGTATGFTTNASVASNNLTWNIDETKLNGGSLVDGIKFVVTENDESAHTDATYNVSIFSAVNSTLKYTLAGSNTSSGVSINGIPKANATGVTVNLTKEFDMVNHVWKFTPNVTNTNSDLEFTLDTVSLWVTSNSDLNTVIGSQTYKPTGSSAKMNGVSTWGGSTYQLGTFSGVPAGFVKPVMWLNSSSMVSIYNSSSAGNNFILIHKIWVVNGYLVSVNKTITQTGADTYSVNINVGNYGSKVAPHVIVYDLVPATGWTLTGAPTPFSFSDGNSVALTPGVGQLINIKAATTTSGSTAVTLPLYNISGWNSYWWDVGSLGTNQKVNINYTITGSGDYPVTDLFVIGIDPAESLNLQSTPVLENTSTVVNANMESVMMIGVAGVFLIGIVGSVRRRY